MAEEGGLEEWNYGIQISAGVSGDQSMGWVGSQAPAGNWAQVSVLEWRCWMSDLKIEPVAMRRAWFWLHWSFSIFDEHVEGN